MDAVVVYESVTGTTRALSEAVAAGLREADPHARVVVVPAGRADEDHPPAALDLVVVGVPVHLRGLPSARSRARRVRRALRRMRRAGSATRLEPGASGPGVREWLDALPPGPGPAAAVFEAPPRRGPAGPAAHAVVRRLAVLGLDVVVPPQRFRAGVAGQPADGEEARARAWGRALAEALQRAAIQ